MKKIFLFILLSLCFPSINAQQLLNPSFDSVYFGGIDRVWDWVPSDVLFMGSQINGDTIMPQTPFTLFPQAHELFGNVDVYASTPYSPVCVKLNTTAYKKNDGTHFETYIVNGDHYYTGADGYIDFSRCGSPFTYRPDSLTGYYQFVDSNSTITDYGKCIILLKKYNTALNKVDTIAYQEDTLIFKLNNWKRFSTPINYWSNAQPDSVVVIFIACTNPKESAAFYLDELSFSYWPNATNDFRKNENLPIIYPNPNSGIIYIENSHNLIKEYRLLTIDGREIQSGPYTESISLPPSNASVFILQLFSANDLIKSFKVLNKQ